MPGWEVFGEEERAAVNDIFDKGGGVIFAHGFNTLRTGYKVREYETAFAAKMGASYAQAVSSGSAALKVALQALGIGQGDEVITQTFTFVATVEAILEVGATPVIVDIDKTLNMDPDALEAAITSRTRCIIPVHMMGECCSMADILAIAGDRNRIPVIEDAAQALGASYYGRPAGTVGDIGCYSTDAGKTLNTGEGGMVVTNDSALYKRARAFHDHGHRYLECPRGEDEAYTRGFNYRMTELQGAIGLAQLKKLDMIVDRQRKNKAWLKEHYLQRMPVEWRHSPDPEGDLADTLVFFLPNAGTAIKFAKAMANKGLATKNLPDAMRWHFAGFWQHMALSRGPWSPSYDILCRAIAIPINIKMDIERTAETLLAIAREIL